jgi:hypothetical protein
MAPKYTLELDHSQQRAPLAEPTSATIPSALPEAKHHHTHAAFPVSGKVEHNDPSELSIYFVGTVGLLRPETKQQQQLIAMMYAFDQATTIFEHKYFVSISVQRVM